MKKNKTTSSAAADLRCRAEQRLQARRTAKARPPAEPETLRLLHELQVHQVELEMQNEGLLAAHAAADADLQQYTDLYDFAPVGYFTLGRDGSIRRANLTGARLLGVERSALSNRRFGLFVADVDRTAFNGFLNGVFEGEPREACEVALCRSGHSPASATGPGADGALHVRIEAVATEDGQTCRAAVTDITERWRLDDALRFLVQCGSTGSGEDFFPALARYLAQSLGMGFVCIDRLEGDGLTARTVAVWCDGKFEDNVLYALKDTPCGEVVGKTVCCFPASVCQFFPRDTALQDLRAESYVGVTLWSHTGEPIGLIATIGRKPLTNPRLTESVLKLVAVRAASELERKQVEEAMRASHEELTRFNRAMVDRELRMIDLKKEINELCKRAGQPARYGLEFEKEGMAIGANDC
ncbi:MAG: hypothetical protein A3K19_30150 [Lentisphaerae bacterium RIFOXYB12_FULL_65_16]|nr:MAG: hypothetical protein A3K18_18855 [Lentisphaerae bacterium RIFOXYA12_64_32]OGV85762.1 MAG: hypothetical protein A3K19_30150 [Lentisphaerae bacterium RIFOXYB12_FULL_65_16]